MSDFILWTRGTKGPAPSVLRNRGEAPVLNEYERASRIGLPIKIAEGDEALRLALLGRLYPPTGSEAERDLAALRTREARQRLR